MIYVSKDELGRITGVFTNPQPDALDDDGNVVCAGVPTVEMAEDHPEVIAFRNRKNEP